MPDPSSVSDLQYLKGVGPRRREALESLGIRTVRDLLYYLPRGYLDRSKIVRIADLASHLDSTTPVTIVARVVSQAARRSRSSRRTIFLLNVSDGSGTLTCLWFEGFRYYKDAFTEGEILALSSYPSLDKRNRVHFAHPQFDRLASAEEDEPDWGKLFNTGAIIPNYSSNAELQAVGLDSRGFRRILKNAVVRTHATVAETLDIQFVQKHSLLPLGTALSHIHFPESWEMLESSRNRLKFDELFYLNLMIALRQAHQGRSPGISYNGPSPRREKLLRRLPFSLTGPQQKVLGEIDADLVSSYSMHRLLQGDVGSGKTVVALLAMLRIVDHGAQVAFMAPTEVLAEQHIRTLTAFAEGLDVGIRLLVGSQKKKLREDVLEDIRSGVANIVVGTHALLEEDVAFHRLGMVVIDEQHRFGVSQRALLRGKGASPELLVMTATPIPRTLALTIYGDLDVSTIDSLPENRLPIRTGIRNPDQSDKAFAFIREEIGKGRQAYVVYPLIERSEKVDVKSATEAYTRLAAGPFKGLKVGLLHGRMSTEEKETSIMSFARGATHVLVCTTVIEVGIDIPNATVMLIEHAERFGLSQLHQLRGRVGRGGDQSYCILMTDKVSFRKKLRGMDEDEKREEERKAEIRLRTMTETTDGFKIADADLRLRGPGDFFGTRQSGLPRLSVANLVVDRELFDITREEARSVVSSDPHLRHPEHRIVRRTFERYYHHLFSLGSES